MTPLGVTRVGDGPPLALVHGWGFAAPALHGLAGALAATRTVELVDLPGHGASRGIPMPSDLPGLADLLDATLPETRDWAGWSLGGLACLQLALTRPGRVRRLALVAATPRFTTSTTWTCAMPADEFAAFAAALEAEPATTLNRFAALVARGNDDARTALRMLREALADARHPDPEALASGLALLAESDLTQATPPALPTLWLLGREDALIPSAALAEVVAAWPAAEVVLLEGTGHAPFLSRPSECATRLEAYLDG